MPRGDKEVERGASGREPGSTELRDCSVTAAEDAGTVRIAGEGNIEEGAGTWDHEDRRRGWDGGGGT